MKKNPHNFYLPDLCMYLLQNKKFYCCISYDIDREDWWDKCVHNSLGWIYRNHIFDNSYADMNIYKPEELRTLSESFYTQSQKISFCTYHERNSRIMFVPYNKIILKPCYENFVEMVRRFI